MKWTRTVSIFTVIMTLLSLLATSVFAGYPEYESNNTIAEATTIPNDTDTDGTMSSASDVDFFKVVLPVKSKINLFMGYQTPCSTCDYDLYLYKSDGTTWATSTSYSGNGPGVNELISNLVLPAGTYYAKIFVFQNRVNTSVMYNFRWKITQAWPAQNTTRANITDTFGSRNGAHNGIDISRGQNDPILAAFDGKVIEVGLKGGSLYGYRGNYVIIEHPNVNGSYVRTRYLHMVDGSVLVSVGSQVKAGQRIGTMGTTGDSTGIHLHFETRKTTSDTPVDPLANFFPTSAGW